MLTLNTTTISKSIRTSDYRTFLKELGQKNFEAIKSTSTDKLMIWLNQLLACLQNIYYEGAGYIHQYPLLSRILAEIINGSIPESSSEIQKSLLVWRSLLAEDVWKDVTQEESLSTHLKM